MSDDELNLDETLELDIQVDADMDPAADIDAGDSGDDALGGMPMGGSSEFVEYAPVWKRIVAMLIDGVVVSALVFGVTTVLGIGGAIGMSSVAGGSTDAAVEQMMMGAGSKMVWGLALMIVLMYLYGIVLPATSLRGTLGKLVMGIGIVDSDHSRMRIGRALWRYIVFAITASFLIPLVIAFFTPKRRALHDFCSGTVVVNKNSCPDEKAVGGGIVSKVLNGGVALLLAGLVAFPVFALVTNKPVPGMQMAMDGAKSSKGSLESMVTAGGNKVAAKRASVSKATGKAAKAARKKVSGKRKTASMGKASANLTGLNKLAIHFEDKAVEAQRFPTSLNDLGMTQNELTNYGADQVKFNSKGDMMFTIESLDGNQQVSMNPYLDDEGYIAWKCGGDIRKKDWPKVCD